VVVNAKQTDVKLTNEGIVKKQKQKHFDRLKNIWKKELKRLPSTSHLPTPSVSRILNGKHFSFSFSFSLELRV
jgi:hypothetical protein